MSQGKSNKPNRRVARTNEPADNQMVSVGGRVYLLVSMLPEEMVRLRTLAEEAICSEAAMVRRLVHAADIERRALLYPGAARTEGGEA